MNRHAFWTRLSFAVVAVASLTLPALPTALTAGALPAPVAASVVRVPQTP